MKYSFRPFTVNTSCMYYFQLCLKGGPAGEGLGHDNEVIMFEAIFAPHFDTSTEKMFSA